MRTLSSLLFYSIAIVALTCGLAAGAWWLVAPDSLQARPIKASAPIPPRIAESIARKMVREPERPKEDPPVKPAMQQANVSLVVPSAPQFKIRELVVRSPQTPRRKQRNQKAPNGLALAEARPAQSLVTTARTDNPY